MSETIVEGEARPRPLPVGVRLVAARPGAEARRELRQRIAAVQGTDPLAPVTVVVSSAAVQTDLRRQLASTGPGIAGTRILRWSQLATTLDPDGGARPPMTSRLHDELVRVALRASDGPLGRVADATSTHETVARAVRRLRVAASLDPSLLDHLRRAEGVVAEIVAIHDRVRELATGAVDEVDRDLAAAEAISAGRADLAAVGSVFVFLPGPLPPTRRRLIDRLASSVDITAIVATTGDAEADAATVARVTADLGVTPTVPAGVPPLPTTIVAAPDAVEEARHAARQVLTWLQEGTPASRIGVLHQGHDPYPSVLRDVLAGAGIPAQGPVVHTLADTSAGRALTGLLTWHGDDHARDGFLDLLHSAPVQVDGQPAPRRRWAELSGAANITRGRRQWDRRLRALARRQQEEADAGTDRSERSRRRVADVEVLRLFVLDLIARLDDPADRTWTGWATWAVALVDHVVGPVDPADEEDVRARDAVASLGGLDRALPSRAAAAVPRTDAVRAILAELAQASDTDRSGVGVHVGTVSELVGVELDRVILVGAVEGAFPAVPAEDPLLPDRVIDGLHEAGVGADLASRAERRRVARGELTAVLATASERTVVWSRVDRRRQRAQVPAPWLLAAAGTLAQLPRPLTVAELQGLQRPWYRDIASHEAGVTGGAVALDLADHRVAAALAEDGPGLAAVRVDAAVARGIHVERLRAGTEFTEHDAHVGPHEAIDELLAEPLSPTGLEAYGHCPRRFLFGRVLRIGSIEEPREPLTVSPRDRGTIVHEVLDRYADEAGSADAPLAERQRVVDRIADEVLGEAGSRWAVGRATLWSYEQEQIKALLRRVLVTEDLLRATDDVTVTESEVSIGDGPDDAPAVTVALPSGRELTFKGRIDRLDRDAEGTERVVASDYKTGRTSYRSIEEEDPVARGTALQGAIYALLAEQRHPDARVRAQYWTVNATSTNPRTTTRGFELDEQRETILDALDLLTEGIARGVFPATPGEWNDFFGSYDECGFCEFDRICAAPGERERGWERDRTAPAVAPVVALRDGAYLPVLETREGGR